MRRISSLVFLRKQGCCSYSVWFCVFYTTGTSWFKVFQCSLSSCFFILNSSQVKIKYEFSKPFPCDCWYVQQNKIIHDILTWPFSEKYKMLRKVNDKDFSYWRQCISKIENIMWRSRLCPIQPKSFDYSMEINCSLKVLHRKEWNE